jgi:hypothetical protein
MVAQTHAVALMDPGYQKDFEDAVKASDAAVADARAATASARKLGIVSGMLAVVLRLPAGDRRVGAGPRADRELPRGARGAVHARALATSLDGMSSLPAPQWSSSVLVH